MGCGRQLGYGQLFHFAQRLGTLEDEPLKVAFLGIGALND